jgi:hypothetical protein
VAAPVSRAPSSVPLELFLSLGFGVEDSAILVRGPLR